MDRARLQEAFEAFADQPRDLKSQQWLRACMTGFLNWLEPNVLVDRHTLRAYLHHLSASGVTREQRYRLWRGLRQFLRWCVEQGFLSVRVIPDGPSFERRPLRDALTDEELQHVYARCRDPWTKRLLLLLWALGWRLEKLLALRWSNVDFEQGRVSFPDGAGHVRLDAWLLEELTSWQASGGAWVLRGPKGKPLTRAEAVERVRLAGRRARLPHLAAGQFQYAFFRRYLRTTYKPRSSELQGLLGQPVHVPRLDIPNLFAPEELRRAHREHSPMRALEIKPTQPKRRK